jgi:hypothetical protein
MTPNAPTWGELEKFLGVDKWTQLAPGSRGGSSEDHVFFEKVLPDGRLLQTHISHSRRGRPSAGRFAAILRYQLEVSREQFWTALRNGEPVDRPAVLEEPELVEHEAWVVAVLARELHMTAAQIAALSVDDAKQRVLDHWSRPTE